eukprot:CAMPEP_0201969088 /NCGR_PEP_ID=MMETSP0904-20121228/17680_1 /ASSEMBLY_ACC=CAM_ASM_000553 /TAXON_ID=420261 /ORGANISM="Thalassiosira antarctica, Strain CCMP982" /LENGTH=49 /DNA_ID= /DNA_START= /DNA_END= /DNA_ORIENTATION=
MASEAIKAAKCRLASAEKRASSASKMLKSAKRDDKENAKKRSPKKSIKG